jgi:ribosome-associated heat shock protein Hsp15
MRLDKWLWAARFFKTRALAAKACDMDRVEWNGHAAKPAREVRVGDVLRIRNESGVYVVGVQGLSEMRGPVAVAQTLYAETEASRAARVQAAEERRAMTQADGWLEGRPSKRDRREIERFRGRS